MYATDSGEDIELGDYRTEDDIPDYKLQENNRSKEDRAEDIPFSDNGLILRLFCSSFVLRHNLLSFD